MDEWHTFDFVSVFRISFGFWLNSCLLFSKPEDATEIQQTCDKDQCDNRQQNCEKVVKDILFCGFCTHQADQVDIKAPDICHLVDNCDSDAIDYHQEKSTGNSFKQVFIAFPWAWETSYLLIPWIRSYDYLHHALLIQIRINLPYKRDHEIA